MTLDPQAWVDELVAQVEESTEDPIKIKFVHDGVARLTEYVLVDVKLEDGTIRCELAVA